MGTLHLFYDNFVVVVVTTRRMTRLFPNSMMEKRGAYHIGLQLLHMQSGVEMHANPTIVFHQSFRNLPTINPLGEGVLVLVVRRGKQQDSRAIGQALKMFYKLMKHQT